MIQTVSERFVELEEWKSLFPSLTALFSTKNGGTGKGAYQSLNTGLHVHDDVQTVIQNRRLLAEAEGTDLNSWIFADQVHGKRVVRVNRHHAGMGAESYDKSVRAADGLWTFDTEIRLSLGFADCVPIYFVEQDTGFIGLAHAGWKGSVANIGAEMISQARDAGVRPEKISVLIGPSIGVCCYIVDDYVINHITQPGMDHVYQEVSDGQYKLDLPLYNKQLLVQAGVKEENIILSDLCTSCEDTMFFSHRRDQGKTGRMSAVIGWKER
ncbi:peptidoglycan editing factor PgeF [Jeotgalibacillus sp. R-1-5s-1]|uniref:peptidoglycan editing factor PgeF n=1 Tax=Jeotgalibacillus sp. R-1-5s-1 TaxID=2555897 RepID=UPI00106A3A20|nr:peptidoglycan editing factor PgeF [Jeotgalibacillus sp. R-1-5s-1]TFE03722.1 peptidoglycan editing factor PgeF [Jeotgalibacillus sp. R-1-5s-1]